LQKLHLSDNLVTSLPVEIGQLSQLARLNLSQNQLTNLPAEIEQLSQLTQLELAENPLEDIAEKNKAAFSIVEWLKYFLNWGELK
jgi:leucine-rich repeat protein SHOC2